ncbi:hypothetical protein ABBQ38_010929 [Trebouxia sp. C0009 RCD-2024]
MFWRPCSKRNRFCLAMEVLVVHGDLRQTNVAVQRGEKGWMVKFVNYDWAGSAGLHRFPRFMNSQIDWPDGVQPLAIMYLEHDVKFAHPAISVLTSLSLTHACLFALHHK